MAYYPLKCPRCLNVCTNETVLFPSPERGVKVFGGKSVSASDIFLSSSTTVKESEFEESEWDIEPDSPNSATLLLAEQKEGHDSSPTAQTEGEPPEVLRAKVEYYTFSQLKGYFVKGLNRSACFEEAQYVKVDIPPELEDPSCPGNLLTAVHFMRPEPQTDQWSEYSVSERYCPCCHKNLTPNAGKMPTYVALLLGTSDAGKTVFLIALYYALARVEGFCLPYNATLLMSLLETRSDFSIAQWAENLFKHGNPPGTTVQLDSDPLALGLTLTLGQTQKKCILYLRDIPGETLTGGESDLRSMLSQFPRFDGFLLLIDPLTFVASNDIFGSGKKRKSGPRQLADLSTSIQTNIISRVDGNVINAPTLVFVTKGDMLLDPAVTEKLARHRIYLSNPALTNRPVTQGDKRYFDGIDAGTRQILSTLSPNVPAFVKGCFKNAKYFLVSAYGRNGNTVQADGRLNTNALKPWRVAQAVECFLMQLNMLPPYDQMDSCEPKPYEANLQLINEWGSKNCVNWVDIS